MKIINIIKKILIIIFSTFVFLLIIDYFFGKFILKKLEPFISQTEFYERLIRIDHPVYHHTLKENIIYHKAKGFDGYFSLCTDNHGFKYKCNKEKRKKIFDYVFIGDSFTEGAAVNYEDSYAGIFEAQTGYSVANMGVTSYAPYIYLSKLKYYLDQGYKFKHALMFVDISDLYDDNIFYKIDEKFVVTEKYEIEKNLKSRKILRSYFPLTNFYMFVIKKINFSKKHNQEINENLDIKFENKKGVLKASWTYAIEDQIQGFDGSIKDAQNKMINTAEKIFELLNENNISLSVIVYPWPQQLMYDTINSKHVIMWKNFCKNKCSNFINLFPVLFTEMDKTSFKDIYKKYYWNGDFHFNIEGNKLIAKELIDKIKR